MHDIQLLQVSTQLHRRLKAAALKRGMRLKVLTDLVVKSWLDKQAFKK